MRLFKIANIEISLDYSWFIIFALICWSLAEGYFPYRHPEFDRLSYWLMGISGALLLFISVLLHELSHSIVSNKKGYKVEGITLFIFGGVSRLTKEPGDAKTELQIALAGPLCSFALFGVFALLAALFKKVDTWGGLVPVLEYLSLINLILGIFNLLPGFPLDGGRVLRAFLWTRTKSLTLATHKAAKAGGVVAMVIIIMGVIRLFLGDFIGGFWHLILGLFLREAAQSSYKQLITQQILSKLKVKDVMSQEIITVPPNLTLEGLVEEYFLKHPFSSYPVLQGDRLMGLITLDEVRKVPREQWATKTAGECMGTMDFQSLPKPDDPLLFALEKMASEGIGRLPIVKDGQLVGMLTRADIMNLLKIRSDLEVAGG